MRYTEPFMNFIMTPPKQDEAVYKFDEPVRSTMRVVSSGDKGLNRGLGEVPVISHAAQYDWITPVVIIVVSGMVLMTLYAVLSKR
jgi:hypothetical protein